MENETRLIDAVKLGDLALVESLVSSGTDINSADEHGWTALNYAAGKGDLSLVRLLIDNGAYVFKAGGDNRTPYMIAVAAGRVDVVKYLREVEEQTDSEKANALRPQRRHCKAYHLTDLRKFPGWSEGNINWMEKKAAGDGKSPGGEFAEDKIAYLHEDLTVTESMWHNENVIFQQVDEAWADFCSRELKFKVPEDWA